MSLKSLAVLAVLTAVPLPAQTPIAPGQTVKGTLQEGDAREDGSYYDAYVVRGRPGERVLVRMNSDDFDAFLASGRQSGDEWTQESLNDDTGGSTDARVIARIGDDGTVELRAAAAGEDQVGRYTLGLSLLGAPSVASIRPGQTVRGRLETTDHEGVTGFEDHYRIEGTPGDTITIHLESTEFDPALALGGRYEGEVHIDAYDDDGGRGTNAALVAQIAGPEPYLLVHAFMPGTTGAYTLRIVRGAESLDWDSGKDPAGWTDADTAVMMTDSAAVWTDTAGLAVDTVAWTEADTLFTDSAAVMPYLPLTVAAGDRVNGVLGEGTRGEDGRWFRHFIYTARAGERLRISLTSDDLDPRVAVGTGSLCRFDALAADDGRGRDRHAQLEWTAPESGEYVIRVTTAVPGETGSFVLRVDPVP
jgi:hypothetical protein